MPHTSSWHEFIFLRTTQSSSEKQQFRQYQLILTYFDKRTHYFQNTY